MSFSELIKIGLERYPEIRYFAFADQDDVWLPEKLSVAINIISQQLTDLPVAYCSATQQVDAALRPIGLVKSREPKMFTKHNALISIQLLAAQWFSTGKLLICMLGICLRS